MLEILLEQNEKYFAESGSKSLSNILPCELKITNDLTLQSVDFKRIWWRLFQNRVVRTKFDIHVFITITTDLSVPRVILLMTYNLGDIQTKCLYFHDWYDLDKLILSRLTDNQTALNRHQW